MIMYVGLIVNSAVIFHVFVFDCLCGCVFISDILLIYSAVQPPVCLINSRAYLLYWHIVLRRTTPRHSPTVRRYT